MAVTMLSLVAGTTVLVTIFLVARWIYRLTFHPLARFPGPRLAAMSSAFAMSYDIPTRTSYIKEFPGWHDKYGPIIRIEPNHLHIRDIEAYNQVYKMGTRFDKDPAVNSFPFTEGSVANNLVTKEARGHRDMYAPSFSRAAIMDLERVIKNNLSTFLTRLDEFAVKSEPIDLSVALKCLTADTIMQYIFNKPFGALSRPGFVTDMITPMEDFMSDWTFTFAWYFPNVMATVASWGKRWPKIARQLNKSFAVAVDQLDFCERRLVELKKAEKIAGPCIFETALNPNPRKGHPVLNIKDMRADAWVLFVAGTDTTANTLCFGTWYLLNNPHYLKLLQDELKQAIPANDDLKVIDQSWANLEKLEFLRCVIKESLRLAYGVPGKNPRVVPPEGTTLCGQFVPGGTIVSMSAYTYHHHSAYFKTHPHTEFRPERWLNKEDAEWNDKFFVPFSRGSRNCLGQNLALANLYLTFAYMYRRFEFEIFETTKEDMEWHDGLLALTFGHLKVKARRRQD